MAYNATPPPQRLIDVIGGPRWLDAETYALSAKAQDKAPVSQVVGPMLRNLLEERCALRVHKESRQTPVYLLTIAKNGPKLKPAEPGECIPLDLNNSAPRPTKPGDAPILKYCGGSGSESGGYFTINSYGISMAGFADRMLAGVVNRPVVDHTGLTGRYDVHLEFAREQSPRPSAFNGGPTTLPMPEDPAGGSIFTALEHQLGLKLVPGKSALDVIVVDSVEKPRAN